MAVTLNKAYKPSKDVVARNVQGEFVLIPITSGIGDLEDAIFSLNKTGKRIWEELDGKRSLKNVAVKLRAEFEAQKDEIETDCLGLVKELLSRRMLIEAK